MHVSVIMPVYNAESTVLQAIESLERQTHPSVEIIVINDGSTDGTLQQLHRVRGRIRLLNHSHRGIVPALNDGLAAAQGRYIARMDADDWCLPERLAEQAAFLDAHPGIGLVGCRVAFGGDRNQQAGYASYVDWINGLMKPDEIALNRFVESPLAHPSVMFRRELPEQFGAYRDGPFPEDYELWLRWMSHGIQVGKVDRELLRWNDPPDRLSRTDERYSVKAFFETKAGYLTRWLAAHNPHHPDVIVWGAGRVTRKRATILQQHGIRITHYIDIKPRTLACGTPVLDPESIPAPESCFMLPMVGNRGAREMIRAHLQEHGWTEGTNCLVVA